MTDLEKKINVLKTSEDSSEDIKKFGKILHYSCFYNTNPFQRNEKLKATSNGERVNYKRKKSQNKLLLFLTYM